MNAEDDLSAALPHPPPARPAAREAAIAAALRRFDGERDVVAVPVRARPAAAWWSGIARPHVAAMAAVALVAVVGLPVMMSGDHRLNPPPAPVERAAPAPAEPAVTADVAPPPVAERAAPVPQAAVSPADAPARDRSVRAESAPAPTALTVPAPPPPAAPVFAAPPPPPAPVMAPPAIAARESSRQDIAVTESRGRRSVGEDIVVTATRRTVPRGDWNACTVDDPRRDLTACKRAAGPPGTPLAEGLVKAWDGDTDAAVAAFDRAIAAAPKSAFAWLNRGLAHARAGEDDAALTDLDRAVRRAPHAARGYYQRSLVLRQRGETKRAERDEQRALELDPDYGAVIE